MIFSKNLLLTGAGFTKNFGGFLATEMWSKIFNYPDLKNAPKIKELFRNNFDFEEVYWIVMIGTEYSDENKKILQEAIQAAYKGMDSTCVNYLIGGCSGYGIDLHKVRKFLSLFCGKTGETGIHFTLNQDLFCERVFKRVPLGLIGSKFKDYSEQIQTGKLNPDVPFQTPSNDWITEFKEKHIDSVGDYAYIKLHGSFGWVSADGSNQMVLGRNKKEDIDKEPILKWYYEIFENALKRPDTKLLIIGYRFGDEHINNILREGVDSGLKLYILSPTSLEKSKNDIGNQSLWNHVDGYFPYTFKELFPKDSPTTNTHTFDELIRIFK